MFLPLLLQIALDSYSKALRNNRRDDRIFGSSGWHQCPRPLHPCHGVCHICSPHCHLCRNLEQVSYHIHASICIWIDTKTRVSVLNWLYFIMFLEMKNRFSPEILGPTASSALAVIILEFTIIKLCVYVLNITSDVPILDLLAYSGYKFVGWVDFLDRFGLGFIDDRVWYEARKLLLIYIYLGPWFDRIIVSIIVQLSKAPSSLFWSVFLYTGAATGFFLVMTKRIFYSSR